MKVSSGKVVVVVALVLAVSAFAAPQARAQGVGGRVPPCAPGSRACWRAGASGPSST